MSDKQANHAVGALNMEGYRKFNSGRLDDDTTTESDIISACEHALAEIERSR